MGTIEEQILDRVFEQLDASAALTSEMREALRELLYAPGSPKADNLVAALTLQQPPSVDRGIDLESAS